MKEFLSAVKMLSFSITYSFLCVWGGTCANAHIGWLVKESKVKRRRYFVLTEKGQLHCYRTDDTRQPLIGNVHLNW